VTKSSNHTLSLHRLTSNPFSAIHLKLMNSQFQFSNLLLATNRLSLYRLGSDPTENMYHVSMHGADHIENTFSIVRMRVCWPAAQHWAWRGPHRNTSSNTLSIVVCAYFGQCLEIGLHVTVFTLRNVYLSVWCIAY
jgi:hypothetical protein